uniref:SCAN box domain-containing protein n=1 Tax=Biomphalaria glabrata TaxID=6526 RepID=A0A2C9M0K1_BIOGL
MDKESEAEKQRRERSERAEEREMSKLQQMIKLKELELEEKEKERQEKEKEREHEREMKKLDLQIAQERNKTPSATTGVTAQRPRLSKGFPAMTTEDLPCYLDMFEMAARRDKVLEEDWVAQLQEKITPKLRQFLTQRRLVDCTDYEKIKKELLDYVGMTEEACRKRWHETVPIEDGPREFFVALQKNFRQWCEAAKIERNFDQLEELILKDSILSALNEEVREEILDKEPESWEKLVDLLENRKIIFSSKSIFKKSRIYQANAVSDRRDLNRQNYLPNQP